MNNRTEIEKRIDILEDDIASINPTLLKLLLKDKTTRGNIMWCTKDYESYGPQYDEHAQIQAELITGRFSSVIQPRAAKSKAVQEQRIKKRAEVFTPSWICNEQNNQVDEAWFGRANVFNTPNGTTYYYLCTRISQGMRESKRNGKSIGLAKGTTLVTAKSIQCKEIIKKHARDFGGTLSDKEVMTLCSISRNSYYKYKRELKEQAT